MGLRWNALISAVELSESEVQSTSPNFPIEALTDPTSASASVNAWLVAHENEAWALLETEEIAKLNPAPSSFGLSLEGPGFNHPYLEWIESAGLSLLEVKSFAPHFPYPNEVIKTEEQVATYDIVFQDWSRLYQKELDRLLNNPALAAKNPYYEPVVIEDPQVAERFLLMKCPESYPRFTDYESGNPELDRERYELALRHWVYVNDPENYLDQYNVESPHQVIEGQK